MKIYPDLDHFISDASFRLQYSSYEVSPAHWQGIDVSKKPEAAMREILNYSGQVHLPTEELNYYRKIIEPNLPWADNHFEKERVSGEPINPGETWRQWPFSNSADKFRDQTGQYNHTYAERYWPKSAGQKSHHNIDEPNRGIRYEYADLNDLVTHLERDPLSRQAYLPVWFPEDGSHNDRKPCSIGYHFILRNGFFHCNYWLRSCDFYRHFRDDIYLTIRLQLWVLNRLRERDLFWIDVKPGFYGMLITSLHLFTNDHRTLFPEKR